MNDQQCIQIAEKVWGLKPETLDRDIVTIGKAGDQVWRDMNDGSPYGGMWYLHDIVNKVNSWSGFGRTVEAMAKRKLSGDSLQEVSVIYEGYLAGNTTREQLWKATHLAPLEAVNNV